MKKPPNCSLCPFVLWVESMLSNEGISQRDLARLGAIPRNQVDGIMSGAKPVTYEFCRTVAQVFKLPLAVLLYQAGLLPSFADSNEEKLLDYQLKSLAEKSFANNQWLLLIADPSRSRKLTLGRTLKNAVIEELQRTKVETYAQFLHEVCDTYGKTRVS
jgi:transcriptional regulator with XRE-family HTH domain